MVTAIIVAAGKSDRMGAGTDKAFLNLGPKPVIAWSLLAFEGCTDVDQIVLVVRKDQIIGAKAVVRMFGISKVRAVVAGGQKRQNSVMNGLKEIDSDTRIVVVREDDLEVGMIVDAVTGVITLNGEQIDAAKAVDNENSRFITGVGKVAEERLIILLNLEAIIGLQDEIK